MSDQENIQSDIDKFFSGLSMKEPKSLEEQVSHLQPITGTPIDPPEPIKRSFLFTYKLPL